MKLFDDERVVRHLDYAALIEALRTGLSGDSSSPIRTRLETGARGDSKVLLLKPAWDDDATVVKVLTLNEMNTTVGLPFIQGIVVVFDKATGSPAGVMDATELTCRRTAAASALAADYLAVPDAETLTVIGTGTLAPHMALAHAVARPIRRVNVFGRAADRARATVAAIRNANPQIDARVVTDLPDAVRASQIVCTATSSREPVLYGRWISERAHIDLVGAFTPDARESDDETIRSARVFVDDRAAAIGESGDIAQPIANGIIRESDIVGDLAELCSGVIEGRTSDREITVFKSVGIALEDLIAAKRVMGIP